MSDGSLKLTATGDRQITMTRVFNAPRKLVFDALTKPELIKRWLLGPPGWTMPVCTVDLKVGGAYRYVWRNECGMEMGVRGVYREIAAPDRIVHSEQFDPAWYSGEAEVTTKLVEQGGQTTVTATILYDSAATRDAVLKSPMEHGVKASYDRLAETLAALSA